MYIKLILSIIEKNRCLTDMRCFWSLTIFSIQNRSRFFRFVPPCRQLILYRFLGFLGISYHQFGCRQKAKTDENCHLNYFIKKVIYAFHGNWDSFDMTFITVIQPKIHKSNGLLKCFQRIFILICIRIQNFSLLSGHNSKKKFFFFQNQSLIAIFQKQPHVF